VTSIKINKMSIHTTHTTAPTISINFYLSIVVVSFLLICVGCARAPAQGVNPDTNGGQEIKQTLSHDGVKRTFHIKLPKAFNKDKPAPLVLALHGGGGRGRMFDRGTTEGTLTAAADQRGIVLVFPEGMNKQWCDGRTEIIKKKCHDDVGFISKIIDVMVADYGIDPRRVYATGISNGGFMSVRLAMDLSNKIAAIAPVAAQISKALKDKTPQRPISVMIINGTRDPLVPFSGGQIRLSEYGRGRGEILSTKASIKRFSRFNGCRKSPVRDKLPDWDRDDGAIVETATYTGCREKTEVVLVRVIGGGHTWPGGKQYLSPKLVGVVCRDINASEMILDFFLRHSR